MYGAVTPPRAKRGAGLDTLVEAMLAQNTNMINATRGYRMLRRRFDSWAAVLAAPGGDVKRGIAVCGLARVRGRGVAGVVGMGWGQGGAMGPGFLGGRPG